MDPGPTETESGESRESLFREAVSEGSATCHALVCGLRWMGLGVGARDERAAAACVCRVFESHLWPETF